MRTLSLSAVLAVCLLAVACASDNPTGPSAVTSPSAPTVTASPAAPSSTPLAGVDAWPVPHPTCQTVKGPCADVPLAPGVPPPPPGLRNTMYGWESPEYPPTVAQCQGGQPQHNGWNWRCLMGGGIVELPR